MTGFRTKRRKHQRDYCDRLFRQRIRERDEMTCQLAPERWGVYCWGPLEVAHFIGRGKSFSVRWSDENAALLCQVHHRWIDSHEADKWDWIRERLGDRYEWLRSESRLTWDKDYSAVLERLKAKESA